MAAARAKPSLARQRTAAAVAAAPSRRVVERVILRLPVPPSANDVWAIRKGGKGMRLSEGYARWLMDAGWRVQQQRVGRIVGGYHITLYLPASSGMDQDNSIAAVSDLMQLQGVIGNDRDAEKTDLRWHSDHNDVVIDLVPFYGSARHLRPLPGDLREAA